MSAKPNRDQLEAFYSVAVLALKVLDARPGARPRLDANADATWVAFKGELQNADRVDLLIRDAAVTQPTAFAPRVVFGLGGLADDDPFGAEWPGATGARAGDWLRAVPTAHGAAFLREAARAWDMAPGALSQPVGAISPATRLIVGGVGALLALFEAFEGRSGFDFAEQVLVVTDRPGERQLAGLAGALLGSHQAVKVLTPTATKDLVAVHRAERIVASADVSSEVARAIGTWRQGGIG